MYLKKTTLAEMTVGQSIALPARHVIITRLGKQHFELSHTKPVRMGLNTLYGAYQAEEFHATTPLTEGILDSLGPKDLLLIKNHSPITAHRFEADLFIDICGDHVKKSDLLPLISANCYVRYA